MRRRCRPLAVRTVCANDLVEDRAPVAGNVNRQPRGAPERGFSAAAAHQRPLRLYRRRPGRCGGDRCWLGLRQAAITGSGFHVIDGALDVAPVFARGMRCILRLLPAPISVDEEDLASSTMSSSQKACLSQLNRFERPNKLADSFPPGLLHLVLLTPLLIAVTARHRVWTGGMGRFIRIQVKCVAQRG